MSDWAHVGVEQVTVLRTHSVHRCHASCLLTKFKWKQWGSRIHVEALVFYIWEIMPGPDSLEVCDNGLCLRDRSRESASAWICAKLKIETRRFKKKLSKNPNKKFSNEKPWNSGWQRFCQRKPKGGGKMKDVLQHREPSHQSLQHICGIAVWHKHVLVTSIPFLFFFFPQ